MAIPQFVAGVALTAAELNVIVDAVDFTAWTAATFQNSWVNFDAAHTSVAYRKVGDVVQVRGIAKSGTLVLPIFTLPAGFRPPKYMYFPTVSNNSFGYIEMQPGGGVVAAAGSNLSFTVNFQFSVTA